MADKPFGLDIGATTMKAVWLNEQKDGFLLKASSIIPTPPKGMISESPLDQEEMVKAIKNMVSEAKIFTPSVNIALPENQVYTKVLDMPVLSEKELASAIYWAAEQHIPVPLANTTLDWKVLKRPKQGETAEQKMQVLLVGAPRILINKYQKIIEMAGFRINAMETEILSVIRAIVNPTKINTELFPNSLIIHIGAVSTLIAIVKEETIVFTYFVAIGGVAVNRAIATDFGFTEQQAEEYKKTYGYSSKVLEGKIGKTTEPILNLILTEVKKAITFYNEKYKDSPIKQILLSGGTAKMLGIDLFFAQNSGIETVTANPWKILSSQEVPKEILDNAPDYTIAVGLAMRDYE